ncbi:XdhC family protein [Serratia ureilytica]
MEAIHTSAFYIGAMGSLRNSARRRQRLQQIAEFTPQELEHPCADRPAAGQQNPGGDRLAVMAAIVQQKTGCRPPTGSNAAAPPAPDAATPDAALFPPVNS